MILSDKEIKSKILKLDEELNMLRPHVLEIYAYIKNKRGESGTTIQSLHGVIMTKNSAKENFVNLVREKSTSFEEFLSKWLESLRSKSNEWDEKFKKFNQNKNYLLKDLFYHKECQEYIFKLLERNFYKNYKERVRFKPKEELWENWFGDSNMFWGLFITPRFENGKWENDKSEMRRTNFEYWTVGHILNTGLVNPDTNKIKKINGFGDFVDFYENILRHNSNSKYEKDIYDMYLEYLKASVNFNNEPLLIPELRFGGNQKNHKHRLDFTIFNSYTEQFTGFELSPQSSHMSISGKNKKLIDYNNELKEKWEKEIEKRNDFFQKNDINIVTFTDSHLKNINDCFDAIKKYLSFKEIKNIDINKQIIELLI